MIQVTFEAETPTELLRVMGEFSNAVRSAAGDETQPDSPAPEAQIERATTPAFALQAAPKRRGRKPRAQKEAETPPPPAPPSLLNPAPQEEEDDPFTPQEPEPTEAEQDDPDSVLDLGPTPAPAMQMVTRDQLRDAANAFIQKNGAAKAIEILGEFGAKKFVDVAESDWPKLYKRLTGNR